MFGLEWFSQQFQYLKEDVRDSALFRMVSALISLFYARCVTHCLVENGFCINFSIVVETCDTVFGLEWFLN